MIKNAFALRFRSLHVRHAFQNGGQCKVKRKTEFIFFKWNLIYNYKRDS